MLRAATSDDRPFVERVFFDTQKWLITELFGWRGEAVERSKFAESYNQSQTKIIVIDGEDSGWMELNRRETETELVSIFIEPGKQRRGVGTALITGLIDDAKTAGVSLVLSTAKINPARRLYERLGFVVVDESEYKVFLRYQAPLHC